MQDALIRIEEWLQTGVAWAGPALAAAALLESLVVVGAIVPATPVLVALGGVMAAGHAPPSLLAWAAAGAFLGNLDVLRTRRRSPAAKPAAAQPPRRAGRPSQRGAVRALWPGRHHRWPLPWPRCGGGAVRRRLERDAALPVPAGRPCNLPPLALGHGRCRLSRRRSCIGPLGAAQSGVGRSAMTSRGRLSLRRPLKLACRMRPAPVHSAKSMLATSSGRTQWMSIPAFGASPVSKGQ